MADRVPGFPAATFGPATAFWAGLTGCRLRRSPQSEFASLVRPAGMLDPAGLPYCVTSRDPGTGTR